MTPTTDSPPEFIARWARKIRHLRLTTPAILLLEMHKPLSFTLGQFLLVGQPVLDALLPRPFTRDAVSLLSDRRYLEQLLQELERQG